MEDGHFDNRLQSDGANKKKDLLGLDLAAANVGELRDGLEAGSDNVAHIGRVGALDPGGKSVDGMGLARPHVAVAALGDRHQPRRRTQHLLPPHRKRNRKEKKKRREKERANRERTRKENTQTNVPDRATRDRVKRKAKGQTFCLVQ